MEEYAAASSGEPWRTAAADDASAQSVLEPALERYQDPVAADKLTKIQRDLDETKVRGFGRVRRFARPHGAPPRRSRGTDGCAARRGAARRRAAARVCAHGGCSGGVCWVAGGGRTTARRALSSRYTACRRAARRCRRANSQIVLHQTIDSVLKRGEKLDSLVDKSADLSMASQMFYKQARKTNSCCRLM
jgi:hypothetical protein